MKKRFALLGLVLLVGMLFGPQTAQAHVWGPSDATASYNQCDGTATIKLLAYKYDDCFLCDDDYINYAFFYFKDDAGIWQPFAVSGDYGGCAGSTSPWPGYTISYSFTGSCIGSAYVEVTITNLPNNVLDNGQIELRVAGKAADDATPDTQFDWVLSPVSIPAVKSPTGLNASSDNCSGITLSWNLPSNLPFCLIDGSGPGSVQFNIYRNGNQYLGAVAYPGTSYTDNTVSPGVSTQYEIEYFYVYSGTKFISGGRTSQVTGTRKDVPAYPSAFDASDDNCDESIDLSWEWSFASPDNFRIIRDGVALPDLAGNLRSYKDVGLVRGQDYHYTIQAKNDCGWSLESPQTIGVSPVDPAKPSDVNATVTPGIGITVTWPNVANETGYKIERSLFGGGGSSFFEVAANVTSYLDESIQPCQTYEYRVKAVNPCKPDGVQSDSVARIKLTPDLSTVFIPTSSLNASKGFFSNRVEMRWSIQNNANFITGYKIFRKQLGSQADSTVIGSLDAGNDFFIDNNTEAGVLYEYFVVAQSQCEFTNLNSNVARSVGFRSPFGVVTGNVSYGGGVAVEGARITAESTGGPAGRSLQFNGSGSLTIQDAASLDVANGLVLEAWVKPASYAANMFLFEKLNSYRLVYNHSIGKYVFRVTKEPDENISITVPASEVPLNNFSHLAAVVRNDSMFIYVNGVQKAAANISSTFPDGVDINDNANNLVIGTGYQGLLDEVRIWNIGKTAQKIAVDYTRLMTGGEAGLVLYLRADEGLGTNAYDFSKTGNLYNENHAAFLDSVSWSTTIPTASQLGAAAYTNNLGNYVLNTPYGGNGEVFVLTPSYLIHEFNPSTRALFLGDGSSVQVGVDFIDKSSFTVSGLLRFKNTECGVKGARIKVDGQLVIEDGVPVTTNDDGFFEIQVPIGEHHITVEQDGHVYSLGRFPASGKYDFQEDLASIPFWDSTLVKVVGRVVGGLREANKIPGLGKSKNNIGTAKVILVSQQGGGCFKDTVFTNTVTGEYTMFVPPLKYVPEVKIVNNSTINFGVLSLVDLSGTPTLQTLYDTTFNSSGGVAGVDSIQFHKQLDYIHRVNPMIAVYDPDGTSPFIGDLSYTFTADDDTYVRDLRANPLRWPVFHQQADDYLYRCLIKVFELYTNLDDSQNIVKDSVPTTDGKLVFNNELSHLPNVEVELKDVNNPDTLKTLIYSFKPGQPNFLPNGSIPAYSYTRRFELNLITSFGQAIPWLPVTNPPQGGDGVYRAYVLGKVSNGDQFVTFGPQVPEYILRDPPGSGSSASREVGTTKSESTSWKWNLGSTAFTSDGLYLGAKFNLGIGVATATEIENNNTFGFKAEISGGNEGSQKITTTNTQSWSTYDNTVIAPGAASDLYIGKSKNLQFGVSQELSIVPNDLLGTVDPLGDPDEAGSDFGFGKKYGISIVPGGYETQFIFNEYDIKNQVLPNLRNLRKIILQGNSKYTSHLTTDDVNYGKNNDDPVFGNLASSSTPYTGNFSDLTGPSYTYAAVNLVDSLIGDSVRVINHQITKWEEALRLNEWEKVNINNTTVIDSLREAALESLYDEYEVVFIAYNALILANGFSSAITYGLIATPVPGTSIAGYNTFAVTTAVNIAQAELAEEYETYLAQKSRIEDKFDKLGSAVNYTFTGGTTFSNSMTHESAVERTTSIEYAVSSEFKLAVSGKVNNNGVGIEKGLELNFSSGRDWGSDTSTTESVSYTLGANIGDLISVDVYPSLLGWGPIFKTKAGSATSCPHEQATVTQYYQPGTVISPVTKQIEKPTLSVSQTIQTNIPADEAAVFNLTLSNESEIGYTQAYTLRTISASNPFGAIVKFDGAFSQSVEVPGYSSLNKVMTIEKGPGTVYDYDSILVVFTSQCQYTAGTGFNTDIADSVYVSAHFLPTCTNVAIASPENQWVLNNSFNDTMPVAVIDYNINTADLEFLRVDYKPSDQPNWIGLQTFLKDTTGMPDAEPIPTGLPFTLYDWDVAQLPDGDYDLRVVSQCLFADKASVTHSGIIDRINPHPFGTPSPADGILSPNDDIAIRFNEAIYAGAINPSVNFDIRGVTNGTATNNSTSLFFDGVNDYAEITGGVPLQQRDFTIEFAAKRNGTGEQCLISQGTDPNERIYIGFDANNKFVFRINDQEVASTDAYTDNNWRYYAVSYDYEGETAQLYVADGATTATIVNTGNTTIFPDYVGNGPMLLGKNSANNGNFFQGNLSEVRVWNRTRSVSEFSVTKTTLLSGNELGLLYNWRLDEGTGNTAEEHLRSRNASLFGPTWQITPGGNSASFDGADDHLKVFTGDVNITQGMDFTLEFWFNSSQAGEATLFSNGTGTGLNADSLVSWNIAKDASGLIHVKHYGIDFVATDEDFFDGSWHHFALVMQRSGNLSAYVDGNLQNAMQAMNFRQLGGANMYLGARGFTVAQTETVENHFNGKLDEFRLWNTARKLQQVRRDMHFRMQGDELGLQLYLPFENYTTASGIPILTPSFNEQVNTAGHAVSNPNGVTLINQTPAIKIQRPVQAIAFTYSVNGDEIILTPTTSQEIIENVTLDITVEGLKDLHGNVMESPATWIAYVDKNQVVWQDDLLAFDMMRGEALSFSTNIVNQGGSVQSFDILDVPSWLTVEPQSGTINPNSSLEVTFTVDPGIPIGDYVNDISLLTDFNFPERLTIDLNVRAEAPNWVVNTTAYEQTMGFIGRLKINNVVSTDDEDILACFVGNQLRGVAKLQYVPQLDAYLVFMDVYGVNGDMLEFRIWDASSGLIYTDVTPNNLFFDTDAIIGTTANPQVFATGGLLVSIEVPINYGWNWLGFPMLQSSPLNLEGILSSFPHANGDRINSQTQASTFSGTSGNWNGTLNGNGGTGIRPEKLYKLSSSQPGKLVMKGATINPTTRPITLANGWNWIGFISLRNQSVTQALGNLTPVTGDIIKGKTQFAMYDEALGWIGSLTTMKPGQGFMYKSIGTKTFTYPLAGLYSNLQDEPVVEDRGPLNASEFSSNMTVVGAVHTNCSDLLIDGRYAIAVYDGRGIARGYARLEEVAGQKICFLTIAGDQPEQLSVRLKDTESGHELALKTAMKFEANQHFGDVYDPFVLEITDEECAQLANMETAAQPMFAAYPSIFSHYLFVEYTAEQKDESARVSLIDMAGKVVYTGNVALVEGANKQRIDLSGHNLPSGMYMLELRTHGKLESAKVMKAIP